MNALILLAAASAPADLAICADRPSKANGVCTVPAGHWQLEVSGVDWTRTSADGVRSDVFSAGSTFVKMGLDSQSDIEAGFTPFIRTSSRGNGVHENASGVGDLVLRYKRRLNGADSATQIGLIPFVKIPTAGHDLGNGKVEGGMVLPVSLATKTGILSASHISAPLMNSSCALLAATIDGGSVWLMNAGRLPRAASGTSKGRSSNARLFGRSRKVTIGASAISTRIVQALT